MLHHAWVRIAVTAGLLCAIVWFAGSRLAGDASSLDASTIVDSAPMLGLALAMSAFATLLLGAAWIVLIEDVSPRRGRRPALMLAFVYAWLVRYVPGTVPFFAGKVYLGQRAGHSTKQVALATGVQNLLEVLVSGTFGAMCIALAFGLTAGAGAYAALAVVPGVGLVALHPAIFGRLADRALRAFGREPLPQGALPSMPCIVLASALTLVNQCLNGVAMLLVMRCITGASFADLLLVTGALSLAGVAGIIVVLAPAGFGVRDGVLTALLSTRFAVEFAVLGAVLVRAVTIVADITLVAIALAADLLSGAGVITGAFRRDRPAPGPAKAPFGAEAAVTDGRPA
ncbi:MAG: lysylphosphatidylglycerol synthase domain-containing protein [Dehalococcoidia bacterium]